nr:reverse transcriptase domain-containing protein [Tanacetum cinerariifolium]
MPATKPRDADATPRVNIQEFCKEYYEDILPIIMDKVHRDRRKDVHTRLDFGEGPRERTREDSHYSSHRRQSAFDRLSETYSPSTTKSRPRGTDSRDGPRGRSRPHRLDTSNEDCPKDRERFHSVGESYDDYFSHSHHDGNRSHHMKRIWDNESPLSSVSKSDSSDGRYRKSRSKRHKSTDEDDLTRPWMCEKEDPFTPRIRDFKSSRRTRIPNNVKTYDGTGDPAEHTMEEMMITTTAFIRGEAAAASKKKGEGRGSNRFTPLTRTPKEILSAEAGYNMDECMQLKKQIEELVRAGKLSHLIKEIKHGRDQSKTRKKETPAKDKPTEIYMIQSWQMMTRQKVTHSFERVKEIMFPPLTASSRIEGPLVIEAEMGRHMIHRMYVDGGSSMEILYEHCFIRLRPEIKNQVVPATTSLTVFSGETIWPLGQLRLLVTIGDANHSTRAWMNFMILNTDSISGRDIHLSSKRKGLRPLNVLRPYKQSWRMCVDFTDLNKACPQDCYPLPEIDWKVKSLYGYPLKCFLEAYKGYHQIQLAELDEDKTAFHNGQGVYCYTKMPFGLKNASATYQQLMDKSFDNQISQNIKVYVDDLVVKSYTEAEMRRDIDETKST